MVICYSTSSLGYSYIAMRAGYRYNAVSTTLEHLPYSFFPHMSNQVDERTGCSNDLSRVICRGNERGERCV